MHHSKYVQLIEAAYYEEEKVGDHQPHTIEFSQSPAIQMRCTEENQHSDEESQCGISQAYNLEVTRNVGGRGVY